MINFSFVMVSRNPKKEWINEALASATGLFDEFVFVDDGSDVPIDTSKFVNVAPITKFIRHPRNIGCGKARNTAIANAEGKWIVSLDDDDILNRDYVLELKEIAIKSDADILHFPIEFFGDENGYWGVRPKFENLLKFNQIPSNSWHTKAVWEKLKGFQLVIGEDWDFWCRAMKHGMKFEYYDNAIYRHRVRPDSMSARLSGEYFLSVKKNVLDNYERENIG